MSKILLPLIIALAVVLRFYNLSQVPIGFNDDEAAFGYNAYSILKTGRDEWGSWPVDTNSLPPQVIDQAQSSKTYFVFNENQKEITNRNLKFIIKFQKGKGNSFMRLFEIIP